MRAFSLLVLFVVFSLNLSAAGPATPEALVSELYKAHDAGKSPFFQAKNRALVERYFTKELTDLIWKDAKTPEGEAGVIDMDPLYNSQDPEIKKLVVNKAKIEAGRSTVLVSFENYDAKQRINFSLVQQDGTWKISDIQYSAELSLLKLFKAAAN